MNDSITVRYISSTRVSHKNLFSKVGIPQLHFILLCSLLQKLSNPHMKLCNSSLQHIYIHKVASDKIILRTH